ncbi:MAG: hypothetical protein LAT78_01700 [Roseinatronobacter sp.]|jgi:hypothetical protein|nr:hypothetical protein [Roseinatronobacter sp.]
MNYLDLRHPFFLPLWRRVFITGGLLCWAGVEFFAGSPFFGVIVLALSGYGFYKLIWRFDPAAFERPR